MLRFIIALITVTCLALPAQAQQPSVKKLENYLESLTTLQSDFSMTTLYDDTVRTGQFYLRRPGRLRFEFNDTKDLIIADGLLIHFINNKQADYANNFISMTPASILLDNNINLRQNYLIEAVETGDNEISYKVQSKSNPEIGFVVVHMNVSPYTLKGWTVYDAMGDETRISLSNIESDIAINPKLFIFKAPEKSSRPDAPSNR